MRRIAIVGGGIAGVTAAYELAKLARAGSAVEAVLFEATGRVGGIVETVRADGFTMECGADGWVTEKPWARELAEELGLAGELIASNDATRKTYVLLDGELVAMPDGMRMMVPVDMEALERSALFSAEAKAAYRDEIGRAEWLKANAPREDESVAEFVLRHFGVEVLEKIGAPLLSGVFGGDVRTLSVRAVMGPFVAMEREHGSLIVALQQKARERGGRPAAAVFTTLRRGGESLIEAMRERIPDAWVRCECAVREVARAGAGWKVRTAAGWEEFDGLMMAAPVDVARRLMEPVEARAAELMAMEASSAVVTGFAFAERFALPEGFGFLVPPGSAGANALLAATFVDQKYPDRAPEGGRGLRGFFGGAAAERLMTETDETIAALAKAELERALRMTLPEPVRTVVRRWPRSLPQYAVGHLGRMAELFERVRGLGGVWLLGNGYRGVGLPDLVRDARAAAREAVA